MRRVTEGLKALGYKKGERAIIYMPMSIEGIVAMQACGVSVARLLRPVGIIAVAGWAVTSYIMLVALLVITGIYWKISHSRLGYELRAVKANVDSAEVIGIHTTRTKMLAATISAGLMGACGVLYAQFNFFFDPDSVFSLVSVSVRIALICIIGGIGTVAGPIIGACFLLPLEELFNATLSSSGAGLSQLAFGLILTAQRPWVAQLDLAAEFARFDLFDRGRHIQIGIVFQHANKGVERIGEARD